MKDLQVPLIIESPEKAEIHKPKIRLKYPALKDSKLSIPGRSCKNWNDNEWIDAYRNTKIGRRILWHFKEG